MNPVNAMAVALFPRFWNPWTDAGETGGPRIGVPREAGS
jgi:hypothetical protein